MTTPVALVLAAGEGRRMGGPKALLVVDGQPLVCAHVERLQEVDCDPIIVVVRTHIADQVRAALRTVSNTRVVAADTSSMSSSLTVGLASLSPEAGTAIVVVTVDTLPPRRSTLKALLAAVDEGASVATPCYRGRGGHPIVARDSFLHAFRDGYPGTLRDLIRSSREHRRRVEVADVAIAHDLDTPEDLATIRPGVVPRFAVS